MKDNKVRLSIDPIRSDELHPDLIHDIANNKFYVEVKDQGYVDSKDLENIIKGFNNSIEILKYLDDLDLSTLEIPDEEE